LSAIVTIAPSGTVFELFDVDLEIWVRGHSRLFKLVPFKSLGGVSYSPSIVTMAVSLTVYEIFSVKVLHDLENWVRGCSRSLEMAQFDRPYTTFYWSAIVRVRGHSRLFKPVPFESLDADRAMVTIDGQ